MLCYCFGEMLLDERLESRGGIDINGDACGVDDVVDSDFCPAHLEMLFLVPDA